MVDFTEQTTIKFMPWQLQRLPLLAVKSTSTMSDGDHETQTRSGTLAAFFCAAA
jgi:hypothetical protein